MRAQHLLDLARIDVVAADDDHVLLAVADVEIAVGVDLADVAGIEPAVAQRLGGLLRPVAIALHDLRPARADFAELDDLDLGLRHRDADRARLGNTICRIEGEHRTGFGLPITLIDRSPHGVAPALERLRRQRGRAGVARMYARPVGA